MPEEPKPPPEDTAEPKPPLSEEEVRDREKEIGDFITRHVLEKDSVFFEG